MRTVVKCFGQLNFKIFFRVVSLICSRCVIVFVLKLSFLIVSLLFRCLVICSGIPYVTVV